jgi:hypothetical protein
VALHLTQKRTQTDRSVGGEPTLRLTRAPLALVGLRSDRSCLRSVWAADDDGRQPLAGLELIDTSGLDTLERIRRRATERGHGLSFRQGQHVAQRPLGLIRAAQLRSEWPPRRAPGGEGSYFALAMACADVDHLRLGDRPGAA